MATTTDHFPLALLAERRDAALARLARDPFDPVGLAELNPVGRVRSAGDAAEYADPNASLAGFDGKSATATFVISTPTRDRHGDWVVPEGCEGRLERYARNPVVFFGHKSYGLPIGSARQGDGPDAPLGVRVEPGKGLVSACRFHLKTAESEQVCALVAAGELRCSSIGFLPVKGRAVYPEESPKGRGGGDQQPVDFSPWVSFVFDEWELLEWSVVAVPANPDCVALRLNKGVGGRPLAAGVRRALEPFALAPKAWSPGFGRGEGQQKDHAIPPAEEPPPPPADVKKRLPHGALTLVRFVRRVSEVCDWLCGEREVLDQPVVKAAAGGWEGSLSALRDAAVTLALAEYPDIDFSAEHAAFEEPAADPAKAVTPAEPVKAAEPPPVAALAVLPAPAVWRASPAEQAALLALRGEMTALQAQQASLKASLRSVTGVLD